MNSAHSLLAMLMSFLTRLASQAPTASKA